LDANATLTPRDLSASATASAGRTCPAVPPAAIRHLGDCCDTTVDGDVKEDPDGSEADHEARAPVGDERKRHACERREPHDRAHVHSRLAANQRSQPRGEPLPEGIAAAEGDVEARVGKERERTDHREDADQAELLADDGEDHVRRCLGQVVDLLHALAEADAEDPSRSQGDHRLHGLEARSLRVMPGVEEAEDARAAVRLEPDGRENERPGDTGSRGQGADGRPCDEEDGRDHDRDRERGSKVRLHEDERARRSHDEPDRAHEVIEGLRRRTAREEPRSPKGQRELGELGGLEGQRGDRNPAAGAVHRRSDCEHGDEEDEAREEQRPGRVPETAVVGS
jgi:hypothetical protein